MTSRTLRGSLEDHSRTKYSNQGPGKRSLPGRPTKAPSRGACRAGQPRPRQEDLAGKRQDPGKRSLPGRPLKAYQESLPRRALRPDKIRRATSFRTRQDNDRSKALAAANYHSVPALQHIHQRVALGPFQARVARGCAASGARWQAALTRLPSWQAVAPLTVPFCTVWATQTGI